MLNGKSQRRGRDLRFKVCLWLGEEGTFRARCKRNRRLEFNLKAREFLPDKDQGPIVLRTEEQGDECKKF